MAKRLEDLTLNLLAPVRVVQAALPLDDIRVAAACTWSGDLDNLCVSATDTNDGFAAFQMLQCVGVEVLELPVEESLKFFENIPALTRILGTLNEVGLGYIALGQSSTTLSGGEAQRVKLATELSKRATGRTLYILDEPTTGLHFADVHKLLDSLHRLVATGNTILIIEHNLDVIKTADWLIDLGPEGGEGGGRIVAEGTPEHVSQIKESYTGKYLRPLLTK